MSFLGDPTFIVTALGVLLTALGVLIAFFQLRHKSANSSTKVNAKGIKTGRDSMLAGRDINVHQYPNVPNVYPSATNAPIVAGRDALELERDRAIHKKLVELLPWDGSIRFIRQKDFRGGAFRYPTDLKDLFKFYEERLNPAFRFIDPELERARLDLLKKIDQFLTAIGEDTFFVEGSLSRDLQSAYNKVPPEWEIEQPERFEKAVRRLNKLSNQVCKCYDSLVRSCGDRLNIS